jgi:diadenosine tetraphosphate (Ap4A) HIT family hydrolase
LTLSEAENYDSISSRGSGNRIGIVTPTTCPFCQLRDDQCVVVTQHIRAFRDQFPISKGHTLIIPRRHVASIFDLHDDELEEFWETVSQVRRQLQQEFKPDAFNIGVNDGTAAGQTVLHAHVHIIPRYAGDVPDPRGGVRWIIPEKADYWSKPK